MADYRGMISLSLPHTPDDEDYDSSELSPRSVPTLSGSASAVIPSSSKPKDAYSSGDISKRPRGRPPGSKNKPKPPGLITKGSESSMKLVVIRISSGADVVDAVVQFARKRNVSVTVLSASGSVSSVMLRHPLSEAPLCLHGPFNLLSLSGSFLCSSFSSSVSQYSPSSYFGICLSGVQGQVFGGLVGGEVVAASLVEVVAAVFVNPSFHKLPSEDENEEANPTSINGSEACPSNSSALTLSAYGVGSPTPLHSQISPDVMHRGPNSRPSF